MFIQAVGLSFKTAPLDVLEKVALSPQGIEHALGFLQAFPWVSGAVVISTCNRTEFYLTGEPGAPLADCVNSYFDGRGIKPETMAPFIYRYNCRQAVGHIFRVASGLDSMVVGETEILGQVRRAYELALSLKATDKVLNVLFNRALAVGKKVRSRTGLDQYPVSVSHLVVDLAREVVGPLGTKAILLIGAGEVIQGAAEYLGEAGAGAILVANRSFDKAEELARRLHGRAVRWDRVDDELACVDVVISSTSAAHYILRRSRLEEIMARRRDQRLLVIDAALPRDVDPGVKEIEGVTLYDMEDLRQIADKNLSYRNQLARQGEALVQAEVDKFLRWLGERSVVPVIRALYLLGEEIKSQEVNRAANRLKALDREKKVLEIMASRIIKRLLNGPIERLKSYEEATAAHMAAKILAELFGFPASILEEISYEEFYCGDEGLAASPETGRAGCRGPGVPLAGDPVSDKSYPHGRG